MPKMPKTAEFYPDGQKKAENEHAWLQRFLSRSSNSIWSKINREKALTMIASGEMKPAGLDAIEHAKKNGRWDAAYDSPCGANVPSDFQAALDTNYRPQHSSRLLTGRTAMRSFGEFKRGKERRLAFGRLSSLSECWREKRRFIPDRCRLSRCYRPCSRNPQRCKPGTVGRPDVKHQSDTIRNAPCWPECFLTRNPSNT